jgi:hypothetical protein
MGTITFDYDGTTLTFPEPEHGNEESHDYLQRAGETDGGRIFVEDPGHKLIHYNWQWVGITDEDKRNLEDFYENTLNRGRYSFKISWANPWTALIKRTIHCDMEISSSVITCDQTIDGVTIYCDQVTGPDTLFWYDVRIVGGSLSYTNSMDWTWHISMGLVREIPSDD